MRGAKAEPGTPTRRFAITLFVVAAVLAVVVITMAIVGTLVCPTQTWVNVADAVALVIWVLAAVLGIRYVRRAPR